MGMQVGYGNQTKKMVHKMDYSSAQCARTVKFAGHESSGEPVSNNKPAPPKTGFKKGLLATLLGLMALTPVGCTTDVGKMEQALEEIPTTQTENRVAFLKNQLRHENPKVAAKAIEHLGNSAISLKAKSELVLEYLQNNQQKVIDAANKLGEKLVSSSETPLNLRQALQRTMSSRPWTESYTVSHTEYTYHYGYNMFNGEYEFHFGPETQYETQYRDHGNALVYQAAHQEVREILATLN
jgi:hypothetical protein